MRARTAATRRLQRPASTGRDDIDFARQDIDVESRRWPCDDTKRDSSWRRVGQKVAGSPRQTSSAARRPPTRGPLPPISSTRLQAGHAALEGRYYFEGGHATAMPRFRAAQNTMPFLPLSCRVEAYATARAQASTSLLRCFADGILGAVPAHRAFRASPCRRHRLFRIDDASEAKH